MPDSERERRLEEVYSADAGEPRNFCASRVVATRHCARAALKRRTVGLIARELQ